MRRNSQQFWLKMSKMAVKVMKITAGRKTGTVRSCSKGAEGMRPLEQMEDGEQKFFIQANGLLKDRSMVAGRAKHLEEIA